jgi:hypothetical protein
MRAANACRGAALALALALLAAPASAQNHGKPLPRSVVVVHPAAGQQYQRDSRERKLQSDLRRSAIERQLRQRTADTARLPAIDHAALQRQMDINDQAREDNYEAHARTLLEKYRSLPSPQPAVSSTSATPAPAHSG